jgi:L-rhamnose mutarotase
MQLRDVNQRWQREMAPFFFLPEGAGPDQLMSPLEEIFHLESHFQFK